MKRNIFTVLCLMSFCSCTSRSCQEFKRAQQRTDRNYTVTVYSNGKVVVQDHFKGTINQEKGDGIYYYKGDTLVEIAGTYVIKSVK